MQEIFFLIIICKQTVASQCFYSLNVLLITTAKWISTFHLNLQILFALGYKLLNILENESIPPIQMFEKISKSMDFFYNNWIDWPSYLVLKVVVTASKISRNKKKKIPFLEVILHLLLALSLIALLKKRICLT